MQVYLAYSLLVKCTRSIIIIDFFIIPRFIIDYEQYSEIHLQ